MSTNNNCNQGAIPPTSATTGTDGSNTSSSNNNINNNNQLLVVVDDLLKPLLAALARGARSVQGLPSNIEDYDYECSFPEFGGGNIQSTEQTWLHVIQSIINHPGLLSSPESSNYSNNDIDSILQYDNIDDPQLWDECADVCERLLEQISELENVDNNNNNKDIIASSLSAAAAASSSSTSVIDTLQHVRTTARDHAQSKWNVMQALLANDIPKPQDIYKHLKPTVLNNDRTIPFVPIIVHINKPFGIIPWPTTTDTATTSTTATTTTTGNSGTEQQQQQQSSSSSVIHLRLQPGHGLETRYGPLRSPGTNFTVPPDLIAPKEHCPHLYESEIQSFTYTIEQLQIPMKNNNNYEPIQYVPTLQATWIDTKEGLQQLVSTTTTTTTTTQQQQHSNNTSITEMAVDLEAHSYRSFAGFVCLMQITIRTTMTTNDNTDTNSGIISSNNYLIDTIKIDRCDINRYLSPLFVNPNIVKVFHGADHDIPWLQRDFGIYVVNMFDTGRAARELQLSSASYGYLLKHYCTKDIIVDKTHQLADWRQRPLSDAMEQYAIQDTHYLLDIYDRMKLDLYHKGGIDIIQQVLDVSRKVCLIRYSPEPFKPSGYKTLIRGRNSFLSRKGGRGNHNKRINNTELNYRQEYVLKELWDWRDKMARKYDESVQYVCTNQVLLRIALASPTSASQLQSLFHPMPALLSHHSQDIITLVKHATVQADQYQRQQELGEDKEDDDDDEDDGDDNEEDGDVEEEDDDDDEEEEDELKNHAVIGSREDDEEEEDDDAFLNDDSPTCAAPSSAFFKPAKPPGQEYTRRRGMMSPVLGTEALYKQAGWMTPQEQLQQQQEKQQQNQERGFVEYVTTSTSTTSTGITDEEGELGSNKPKRLLSVHASNKEYNSKQYTEHSIEIGKSKESNSHDRSGGRIATLDGMGTVRAAMETTISGSAMKSLDETATKELALQNATRIQSAIKDSIPAVLGLASTTSDATRERTTVSGAVEAAVDDDDGTDDDAIPGGDSNLATESRGDNDENEALLTEECFVIPRSIREIYRISNRNRRNKKAGSPTPERGMTPTNEKERRELMHAEALLKERGLIDEGGNSFFFEDNTYGSSPGKRPRAKSGRESEESVPDTSSNIATKEDDLAFMKKIGWIQNEEEVGGILSQRYGKSRTDDPNETDVASAGGRGHPPEGTDQQVLKESSRPATLGACTVADTGTSTPSFAYNVNAASAAPPIGLIQPGQPVPANNPFFSGAAMLGGPLTEQGLSKTDTKTRKSGSGKGKPNRVGQQERPDKRGNRSFAYRKR